MSTKTRVDTRIKGITLEQIHQMGTMYEAGFSLNYVAKEFGLCRATVAYHLQRRGFHVRSRQEAADLLKDTDSRIDHLEVERIVFLYHQLGLSGEDTAKVLGIDKAIVYHRLKKAGRPPRHRSFRYEERRCSLPAIRKKLESKYDKRRRLASM